MKKIVIATLVAFVGMLGNSAKAQETSGFSVKAGVNFNTFSRDNSTGLKSLIGYHIGATYEFDLGKNFAVEPGLFLDTRGAKFEGSGFVGKTNIIGLTVPVLAKGRLVINNDLNVFVNAGPFVNIGLGGTRKTEAADITVKRDVTFGNGDSDIERTNFGLNFGAGIEYQRFILGIGYDLGLSKVNNLNTKTKLNAFKISVGYKL